MVRVSKFQRIVLVSVILALVFPCIVLARERRVALVIGNSAYKDAPLKNAANDARDMASALKNLGFHVTLNTDADQRTMKESIRSFGRELQQGGVGLFYYAGHGIQYRGRNYLIPLQADVASAADVEYEAVDAGRVLAQMEDAGNNLNIIILDACRNNPFARSFRSAEKGLARMDAPTGSLLAYATAPGSVASDGSGRNGLYTEKLLKYMKAPGLELGKVFRKVRIEVLQATNKQQVPWESSSLTGDFYFAPAGNVPVAEKPALESVPVVASIPQAVSGAKIDGEPVLKKRSYLFAGNTNRIRGKRIRVPPGGYWERYVKKKGGSPLKLALPEVYAALRMGVIDAAILHPDVADHFRIGKVAKITSPIDTPYPNITFLIGNVANLEGMIYAWNIRRWEDMVIRAGGKVYSKKLTRQEIRKSLDKGLIDGVIATFEGKELWIEKMSYAKVTPLE